jgi:hypothetical protein
MDPHHLILKLRRSGYSIVAEGSYLDISPAENLPSELVEQLKQSKSEILCALHLVEELKHLVQVVSTQNGFSQEDYEETLNGALADPVNALTCFATLAHQSGVLVK